MYLLFSLHAMKKYMFGCLACVLMCALEASLIRSAAGTFIRTFGVEGMCRQVSWQFRTLPTFCQTCWHHAGIMCR